MWQSSFDNNDSEVLSNLSFVNKETLNECLIYTLKLDQLSSIFNFRKISLAKEVETVPNGLFKNFTKLENL